MEKLVISKILLCPRECFLNNSMLLKIRGKLRDEECVSDIINAILRMTKVGLAYN